MQLSYGEDNLDPVAMEDAGGKPINLPRSLSVVNASLPQHPHIPENASDEGKESFDSGCPHDAMVSLLLLEEGSVLSLFLCCKNQEYRSFFWRRIVCM